jgi:signal recognition particle receptor subunit beta
MDKIIFTGPMGAGKTTAIASISEIPPISTDVRCSDEEGKNRKENTTVAMDYGYITLAEGERIHLYGTPGQARFDYMWNILTKGGLGLVLLLDNMRPEPLTDLAFYLDQFKDFISGTGVVIGVTRTDLSHHVTLVDYQHCLMQRGQIVPVFEIDARQPNDVKVLIHALLSVLQGFN